MAGVMPEAVQQVQRAVEGLIEDIQKSHLLPRQKDAFLCCAKCCDTSANAQQLEGCVQNCSRGSMEAQRAIQQQLGAFQERFQREAMRCQDQAREMMPFDASPSDQQLAQDKFNSCMEASGREFLSKVPKLKQDILAALKRA